jgi:hypothetical protein
MDYNRTISGANPKQLSAEIFADVVIGSLFDFIKTVNGDDYVFQFNTTLTAPQEATFDGIISGHSPVAETDDSEPLFNENTYTEESTIVAGDVSGTWVVRSLGAAYANRDVEMKVYKSANNYIKIFGVREVGSSVPKYFPIRRQCTHMEVRADANGDIEILSTNADIIFEVTGRKPLT